MLVPTQDRRKSPRIVTTCRCWPERESLTLLGTVTNLGSGGLFLKTPVMLATGAEVNLTLSLKDGRVLARGRVIWAKSDFQKMLAPGLGISLDEVVSGRELLMGALEEKLL